MRKKTKLELLIEALSDGNWHWGDELAIKVSHRFGATIKDARGKGYRLQTDRVGLRHRYRIMED
jgi:biotin operon repressor